MEKERNRGNAAIVLVFVVVGTLYFAFRGREGGVTGILSVDRPTSTSTIRVPDVDVKTDPKRTVISRRRADPTPSPTPATTPTKKQQPAPRQTPPPKPPEGFTAGDLSPLYRLVRISSLRRPSSRDKGSLHLLAQRSLSAPVVVTGWQVDSNRGSITVPQAVSDWRPYGADSAEITLSAGGRVELYGEDNIYGPNVRINKCAGYLNSVFPFKPAFPLQCPREADKSSIAGLTGDCQKALKSVRRCKEPDPAYLSSLEDKDSSCFSYIQGRFGYGNCYYRYRSDADFFSNTWRVWLDRTLPFDPLHDRLVLRDSLGKVVDVYLY